VKVRRTRQAEQDRADILVYIAEDNVRAAISTTRLCGCWRSCTRRGFGRRCAERIESTASLNRI